MGWGGVTLVPLSCVLTLNAVGIPFCEYSRTDAWVMVERAEPQAPQLRLSRTGYSKHRDSPGQGLSGRGGLRDSLGYGSRRAGEAPGWPDARPGAPRPVCRPGDRRPGNRLARCQQAGENQPLPPICKKRRRGRA